LVAFQNALSVTSIKLTLRKSLLENSVVSLPSLVDFSSDHFNFECRKIFTKCRFLAGFSKMFPGLNVGVFRLKIAVCRM
jgi:hypothetical protein